MSRSSARLKVVAAGPHVTVQDGGRPGRLRYGVPASGPMDRLAHAVANAAVGNDPGAAAIEISPGGSTVECVEGQVTVAVVGGSFSVRLGGRRVAPMGVHVLASGDQLAITAGRWGSWCYLAVAGDVDAPEWLGSRSVHTRSRFGGVALVAGDDVVVRAAQARPDRSGPLELGAPLDGEGRGDPVRVVLGPQLHRFDEAAVRALLGSPFRVTAAYDRMGMRLDGASLAPPDALSIPSEPIVPGSIQVAGDGVPTVLLADHQTVGGYPKIATVIGADLDRLAQHRPGDEVEFRAVTPVEAVHAARHRHRLAAELLEAAARPARTIGQRLASENLIGGAVDTSERADGSDPAADPANDGRNGGC